MINMTPVKKSTLSGGVAVDSEESETAWEYQQSLTGASTGEWIAFPIGADSLSLILQIISGTGRLEYTTDSIDSVIANTAIAQNWDAGNVAVTTSNVVFPISAWRAVCVSGSLKAMGRAQ